MRNRLLCAAGALLIPLTAATAEERRELDAHEHGHGKLNIAVEGKTVGLELRVPGADIVGFEHEAKSDKDKASLKSAKQKLAAPLDLFRLPSAAGCKLTSSFAHYTKDEDHAEQHAKHHGGKHAEHHNDGDDHHEEHAKSEHAEFHAGYELTCTAPEKLTSIDFAYFGAFKNSEELEVNVVTAKGQAQYEVTRDKPKLDLGGVI
jgi:uncharacterized protein DUF2796